MKKARRTRKKKEHFRFYLLAVILVFASATTASYFYFKPKLAVKSPFIENIESHHAKEEGKEGDMQRLYDSPGSDLTKDSNRPGRDALLVTAEDVIRKHIAAHGAELLDLYMDNNGIIYADFSSGLRKNFRGDAAAEYRLISGLYKSIKEVIPDFTYLKILIGGKEVESFGGHIDISKPIGEELKGVTQRKADRYF